MVDSIKPSRRGKQFAVWHWILQRLSGILLIPLSLWFVWGVLPVILRSPTSAEAWFHGSFHTLGAIVWTGLIFYHGLLGIQVILEDYISCKRLRFFSVLGAQLISLGGILLAIFQILHLSSGS
ncbi:MAG: succinate dehydrogenase, hydrophobic membrane anchor protein [Holosporales bacterium]|nr:succinate dehydrogenase, hydrophobic membrane anchor protein [Holosporales bacterium]